MTYSRRSKIAGMAWRIASAVSASASEQTDVTFRATSRMQIAGHGVVEVTVPLPKEATKEPITITPTVE